MRDVIRTDNYSVLDIWDLNFDIVSDFEFRYSDLYEMRLLSYLTALEEGNGQCEYGCSVAQGVRSSYHDIFYRDLASFVNGVANPENL